MELPKKFLKDILKSVLEDNGLDPNSRHVSKKIAAHLLLSALYRVTVYFDENGRTITRNFIFKTLRSDPEINEKFDAHLFFKNEALFYSRVLATFKEFQSKVLDKGVAPWHSVPKCYKTSFDNDYVLVLEDLTESGYNESDRFKSLNILELRLLMKELGKFHALSLAIKDKDPSLLSKLKDESVTEVTFRTEFLKKTYNTWASSVSSWVLTLAKESFPHDSPIVTKLETFSTDNMPFLMQEVISPKAEDEKYNVFTHGDLWVSNLLFYYQSSNKPDRMCLVDFQQCRYGSLALDVNSVLFLLMDQKMRDEYRNDLLHTYHQCLTDFLSHLGCDPEKLFPFSDLEIQLSKYALFNLGMAFLCLSHNLSVDGDEDMNPTGKIVTSKPTEECRNRILNVIEESVTRGYLK